MGSTSHHGVDGPPSQVPRLVQGTRFRVEVAAETGSTNADLVERAAAGEADGLVLRTDHQTAGRGRLDRRWEAPPGSNLLFSVLLRPDWPVERLLLVTSALAVSLVDVLVPRVANLGMAVGVKWPNDVLVGPDGIPPAGKVAGILAEMVGDDPPAVVVGMGVNVGWPGPGDETPPGATSLAAVDLVVRPEDLLDEVLHRLDGWCTALSDQDGPDRLRSAHLERSATVDRRVAVDLPGERLVGKAVDVTILGNLVVDADGRVVEASAGDVVHLRTAGTDADEA